MTEDSAFKKQVRARMAETGEKYTVARRMIIAQRDPGGPAVTMRVYLSPHVDLSLPAEACRAYATADEQGRRDLVNRLLADHLELAGSEEARVATGAEVISDQERPRAERADAEDAALRAAVQRAVARAVGVSVVKIDWPADRVRVTIRAARPILLAGPRGAEADRLRGELEELTGGRVQLDLLQESDPGAPGAGAPGASGAQEGAGAGAPRRPD